MGNTQSKPTSLQILKVKEDSPASSLLPFIHFITKYNNIQIKDKSDITSMLKLWESANLELEIIDARSHTQTIACIPKKNGKNLGISVKLFEGNISLLQMCILDVQADSPAFKAGLIEKQDYIIGVENVSHQDEDDFFSYLYANRGKVVVLIVYNIGMKSLRRAELIPRKDMLLGCEIGSGMLYNIPEDDIVFDWRCDTVRRAFYENNEREVSEKHIGNSKHKDCENTFDAVTTQTKKDVCNEQTSEKEKGGACTVPNETQSDCNSKCIYQSNGDTAKEQDYESTAFKYVKHATEYKMEIHTEFVIKNDHCQSDYAIEEEEKRMKQKETEFASHNLNKQTEAASHAEKNTNIESTSTMETDVKVNNSKFDLSFADETKPLTNACIQNSSETGKEEIKEHNDKKIAPLSDMQIKHAKSKACQEQQAISKGNVESVNEYYTDSDADKYIESMEETLENMKIYSNSPNTDNINLMEDNTEYVNAAPSHEKTKTFIAPQTGAADVSQGLPSLDTNNAPVHTEGYEEDDNLQNNQRVISDLESILQGESIGLNLETINNSSKADENNYIDSDAIDEKLDSTPVNRFEYSEDAAQGGSVPEGVHTLKNILIASEEDYFELSDDIERLNETLIKDDEGNSICNELAYGTAIKPVKCLSPDTRSTVASCSSSQEDEYNPFSGDNTEFTLNVPKQDCVFSGLDERTTENLYGMQLQQSAESLNETAASDENVDGCFDRKPDFRSDPGPDDYL